MLNESKTKIIIFGNKQFHDHINLVGTFTQTGECITFNDEVKYLGVFLDNLLSFEKQINKVVSSCYNELKNIASIRNFISQKHCEQLIHALITSKLDYCNSLYFGLPKDILNKLQCAQNAAMRLLVKKKKRQSVHEDFLTFHWLNIEQRIIFKVLLITYKCLNNMAPYTLSSCLQFRGLQEHKKLQENLFFASTKFGHRAFTFYSPRLWNCLPTHIIHAVSIDAFKGLLKTFLFSRFSEFKENVNRTISII